MTPIDTVLDRLEGVRKNGSGYQAKCPAHEDRNPSLSVSKGSDGVVLVKCHAGCDAGSVVAAAGLQLGDLFPPKPTREIAATYDYVDEARNLLIQVVRYEPKEFRQRRPGGPGEPEWIWKLGKTRRVLYRLPEVLGEREVVYVVEGEKDADALAAVGLTATTSIGGAGKWRDMYCESLAHVQTVVVVADRDEPGRDHARQVAASIVKAGKVQNVDVVQPPDGCKDISDMVAKGMKRDALEPLPDEVEDEPTEEVVAIRRLLPVPISSVEILPVRWMWDQRVPVGEITLTAGLGGIGKSTFHSWLIANVTRGTLEGESYGKPKSVIVVVTEDSYSRTVAPRLLAAGADLQRVYRVDAITAEGDVARVSLPGDVEALTRLVRKLDVVVVSLDPLMTLVDGSLDTHKDHEVRRALEPLAAFADNTGTAVVGNGHFNKASGADPMMRLTGSAAFGQVVRSMLAFAQDPDSGQFVISQAKNNLGRLDLPSLAYRLTPVSIETKQGPTEVTRLEWSGDAERSVHDILADKGDEEPGQLEKAIEWLESVLSDDSMPRKDVVRFARGEDISERTLERARAALDVVVTRDENARGKPSTWSLPSLLPSPSPADPLAVNQNGSDLEKQSEEDYLLPTSEAGSNSNPTADDDTSTALQNLRDAGIEFTVHPAIDGFDDENDWIAP